MQRRKRIYGPYEDRGRWKIIIANRDGSRSAESFGSRREAEEVAEAARLLERQRAYTMTAVLNLYESHQRNRKKKKPSSIATTQARLVGLLADVDRLYELTPKVARRCVDRLAAEKSVATARNTLGESRTFGRWLVREGLLDENPFAECEVYGEANAGKESLTEDEAIAFEKRCLELAEANPAPLACLLPLVCDLRAGEVVSLRRRDLDRKASILWVARTGGKTRNARRSLLVPDHIAGRIWGCFESLELDARLWPRKRDWLYRETVKIGDELGIPKLGPQRLRATHATLAIGHGMSPLAVAQSLGHSSPAVTMRHYADRDVAQAARQSRVLDVLRGGGR